MTLLSYLFFNSFWDHLPISVAWFGVGTYFVFIISYILTFLKNPGIPKANSQIEMKQTNMKSKKGYKFCNMCKIFINMDNNVYHCEDCNVCIEGNKYFLKIFLGYDHHCPWTSKCIGKGNINVFYVFVFSIVLLIGYVIFGVSIASSSQTTGTKTQA